MRGEMRAGLKFSAKAEINPQSTGIGLGGLGMMDGPKLGKLVELHEESCPQCPIRTISQANHLYLFTNKTITL